LFKALTLPGSYDGIVFLFTPDWHELLTIKVWYSALKQLFFSLGISAGMIVNYAAYNPFDHDIYRDGIILSCTDTFTSILAGVTIFSVLGNLAKTSGVHVKEVNRE
jgi:solute carrier family 6 amino acid transporter-like protein 5/7/9/14